MGEGPRELADCWTEEDTKKFDPHTGMREDSLDAGGSLGWVCTPRNYSIGTMGWMKIPYNLRPTGLSEDTL